MQRGGNVDSIQRPRNQQNINHFVRRPRNKCESKSVLKTSIICLQLGSVVTLNLSQTIKQNFQSPIYRYTSITQYQNDE